MNWPQYRFGSNKVAQAQAKVDEVKAVMRENVDLALSNVDRLEVMEEKAGTSTHHHRSRTRGNWLFVDLPLYWIADMEKEAKSFERGANKLAWQMRCRNWKLVMLMVLLVVAVLTAIIYPLANR